MKRQYFCYVLFAVYQLYAYAEFLVQMVRHMLCRVNRAMLSASATERYAQMCESTLKETFYVRINKRIYMSQEFCNFAVFFQKAYNGFIASGNFLVLFVAPRVMHRTAVEHVAASVARRVVGQSFLVRETHHPYR